jgi:FkbM family methyltransferase
MSIANCSRFLDTFLLALATCSHAYSDPGVDRLRFGVGPRGQAVSWLNERLLGIAYRAGFVRRSVHLSDRELSLICEHLPKLEQLYDSLADDYSKNLLIVLLTRRVLGYRYARLPINTSAYWEAYRSTDRRFLRRSSVSHTSSGACLNEYEMTGVAGPLHLRCQSLNVLNTFLLEQYAYRRGQQQVEVRPGDTVIDGGGCWGDSALYFADRVGSQGKVYAFEFTSDNLRILHENLALNPHLADQITIVSRALWDRSDTAFSYVDDGPGSQVDVGAGGSGNSATTVTIDDFVSRSSISRVDFIKMDIEGSELAALHGAEQTIRACHPRLAISVYHKPEDLMTIPQYLSGLTDQYAFFLDHFTVHGEETVLFAIPTEDVPRELAPVPA